jgi:hypothetical protein
MSNFVSVKICVNIASIDVPDVPYVLVDVNVTFLGWWNFVSFQYVPLVLFDFL